MEKRITGMTLAEANPKLAKSWHPTLNLPLGPADVTRMSRRRVWWKCEMGHEWQAQIYRRMGGSRCPYCIGRKACKDNSLRAIHPELAAQWHTMKNGALTPDDVTAGCNKKVWWKCARGHEWQTKIVERHYGSGCPFCAGQRATEETSLHTLAPGLAGEWHPTKNTPLTPKDVTFKSNRKVWWVCRAGHEWQATPTNRSRGQGCPYCAGRRVCKDNCLRTINPELAEEWHPTKNGALRPEGVTIGHQNKVWWRCARGHEWQTPIYHRNKGSGCPFCAGQRATEQNCLETVNPALARQWHPTKNNDLTPADIAHQSSKTVWWICKKGHEWKDGLSHRHSGRGCPYCAGKRVCADNCLQTLFPEVSKEWHPVKNAPLTPSEVTHGSEKKVWWLCRRGHEWMDRILTRTRSRGAAGCPYCSGRRPVLEESLAVHGPWVASQWHPTKNGWWMPKDVFPHSARQIWWLCEKGHEIREPVADRYRRGGCSSCIIGRRQG